MAKMLTWIARSAVQSTSLAEPAAGKNVSEPAVTRAGAWIGLYGPRRVQAARLVRGALLVLLVLALPPASALGLPAPAAAPGDPGGPGCRADDDGGATCLWTFNNTDRIAAGEARPFYAMDLPANATFPRALATVTVSFAGEDNGWSVGFQMMNATESHRVSTAGHAPDSSPTPGHASTSTHALFTPPDSRLGFHLWTSYTERYDYRVNVTPPSVGSWRVVVRMEPLPEGVKPARPAATRADPQLLSGSMEAAEPDRDIREAWFDDARLGDGVFDVHLAVASLDRVDFNTTRDFGMGTNRIDWVLAFRVKGVTYEMTWWMTPNGDREPAISCELFLPAADASGVKHKVVSPGCHVDFANATFVAFIPERSVQSPSSDDLFTDIRAATYSYPGSSAFDALGPLSGFPPPSPVPDAEDETQPPDVKYAFALGGPAVWHTLNPRLDPLEEIVPPWYVAPLATENIPNTLQVVGALLAGVTFLFGALAVLARRRQIRKHLDRIDAIERSRTFDSQQTLRELGLLEDEFARLFRKGRLTDAQFQILSQRIASVATRFALRRELGLDDGVPGEGGPTTRVPVRGRTPEETTR